jgi:hypothetical protein
MEVLENMVNMQDLLTSRPNGIVRVKALGAVKRIDNPLLGAPFYSLLEYFDKIKTDRVGARSFGDAVDPNALNAKAHTAELVSNAAQERINLMARIFAETAVKDIFWKILELISKHQDKRQVVKLRGKWVDVDPREWKDRFNMTVTVGLGTGSQQAKIQSVMTLGQLVQGAIQAGLAGRVVTEENIYHLLHIAAKATFPKEADMLFTNPKELPPPQEKPDPEMLKLQLQKEKQDQAVGMKQMKMQMDAALDERDKQFQAAMQQFQAMSDRAEQDRKHQAQLLEKSMEVQQAHKDRVIDSLTQLQLAAQKGEEGQSGIVLKGVIDSLMAEQKSHHDNMQELVRGHTQVMVEKAKPKPKPKPANP